MCHNQNFLINLLHFLFLIELLTYHYLYLCIYTLSGDVTEGRNSTVGGDIGVGFSEKGLFLGRRGFVEGEQNDSWQKQATNDKESIWLQPFCCDDTIERHNESISNENVAVASQGFGNISSESDKVSEGESRHENEETSRHNNEAENEIKISLQEDHESQGDLRFI